MWPLVCRAVANLGEGSALHFIAFVFDLSCHFTLCYYFYSNKVFLLQPHFGVESLKAILGVEAC